MAEFTVFVRPSWHARRRRAQESRNEGAHAPCAAAILRLFASRRSVTGARPRGGVVTQRTANPCTPVRFRARPPLSIFQIRCVPLPLPVGWASPACAPVRAAPLHAHHEIPPPPPNHWQILRQHQKPEGNHPEAEHRQEPQGSAGNQPCPQRDAGARVLRQMEMTGSDADLAAGCIEMEDGFFRHGVRTCD